MKTNVFHSERQASCDVLFYPITPVFCYSSDVTGPGGFRKTEIRRETEKKIFLRYYATVLMLNMLFQTTRCDSADVKVVEKRQIMV